MIAKEYRALLEQTQRAFEFFAENPQAQNFENESKLTWITILTAVTQDQDLENGIEKDLYVLRELIKLEKTDQLHETTPANIAQLVEAMEAGKLSQAQTREKMGQYFQSLKKVYVKPLVTLPPIPDEVRQIDSTQITKKILENSTESKEQAQRATQIFVDSLDDQKRMGIIIAATLANPNSDLTNKLFSENNIRVSSQFENYKKELVATKKTLRIASAIIDPRILDTIFPTEQTLLPSQYVLLPFPPDSHAVAIERDNILAGNNLTSSIHTTTQAEVAKYTTVDPDTFRKPGSTDNLTAGIATFGNRVVIITADKKLRSSDATEIADAADLHRKKITSPTLRALAIHNQISSDRLRRIIKIVDRLESRYSPEVARTLLIQSGNLSSNEVASLAQGTYTPQLRGLGRVWRDVSQQFLGTSAANRVQGLISEKKEKVVSGIESQVAGFAGRKSKGILSSVGIKAAGWIAARSGLVGTLTGGAVGSIFGPIGMVVGASLGAAAGGITFGAQAAGIMTIGGAITFGIIGAIAIPLAILFVTAPILVALTLFIINSGAYVVPGSGGILNHGKSIPHNCFVLDSTWKEPYTTRVTKAIEQVSQAGFYMDKLCAKGDVTLSLYAHLYSTVYTNPDGTQVEINGLTPGNIPRAIYFSIKGLDQGDWLVLYLLSHESGHVLSEVSDTYRTFLDTQSTKNERPDCTYFQASHNPGEDFAEMTGRYIAEPSRQPRINVWLCSTVNSRVISVSPARSWRDSYPNTWQFAHDKIFEENLGW